MISDTKVHDIFSLIDGIFIRNYDGVDILCSLFIAIPVVISYVPLCNIIFKTEEDYFKFLHTVNVPFIGSEQTEGQFSHITTSIMIT